MSALSIIEAALDAVPVTSVTSPVTREVTEKPFVNQAGYSGYSGYSQKQTAQAANESDADHQAALDEAIEERAAVLEFDGGLDRAEAERIAKGSHAAYINHVMQQERTGCGCRTRAWTTSSIVYCAEGQRLRDAYHAAIEEASR